MGIMDVVKGMFGGGGAGSVNVMPEEIEALVKGGAVVLDVREATELQGELGAIKGAKNLPLSSLSTRLAELDKTAAYVLICRSGHRSSVACRTMSNAGFEKLYNVSGGMIGYRSVFK